MRFYSVGKMWCLSTPLSIPQETIQLPLVVRPLVPEVSFPSSLPAPSLLSQLRRPSSS